MKILVASDSHGCLSNLEEAVNKERPQYILHLGDGWRDAEQLRERYPEIPLEQVRGNCDFGVFSAAAKVVCIADQRIFLCHGHTYRVKDGLWELGCAARAEKADLALFGHTHIPTQEWADGVLLLNPGSIGYGAHPSYAVVKIEDGRLTADLRRLE